MAKHRLLGTSALALMVAPALIQSAHAQDIAQSDADQAKDKKEIVVTGTLIQRSDYQSASPIDTVSRADLEARVPNNVAEFVKDIPANFGSAFASGRAFGNERGAGTINLRGLGASATLVLVNSRRQTQLPDAADNVVDVNSLIPEIMLERVEILKDGASALYGSDAVAGVVNFITNDRFNGVKLNVRGNEFTYSKAKDYRIEGLIGRDLGSNFHAVLGLGWYSQDPINGYAYTTPSQSPSTANELRFTSPSSFPGEFVVPTRNAAGVLSGSKSNIVDPTCGTIVSSFPTVTVGGLPQLASSPATAVDCRYNFWGDNGSQSAIDRFQSMVRITGELGDVKVELEGGYTNIHSETAYTAGDTLAAAIVIPGHNPGNIYYRAVNSAGQPLYAVSSGVSAGYVRDGAEVFLPVRDSAGKVVLTGTPTAASSGIPFYEDVTFSGRPIGSQCDLPTGNSLTPGQCAWGRPSVANNDIYRFAGGLSGALGEKWNWRAGATYSRYELATNGTVGVALVNELKNALAGFGGASCNIAANTPGKNGCQYFNLFGNSALATAGSAQANSPDVINYVMPLLHDKYTSSLFAAEAIVSGDAFELPGGPLGVALGYQYRRATLAIDYDLQANAGNKANGVTQSDLSKNRANHAFFAEVVAPLMDGDAGRLEFDGAIRHERIGSDLSTTNPKLGLLYNTQNKVLTLRASYGTSFIAPSLFRLFADSAQGTAVNDCPVSQGAPCRGDLNLRVALLVKGNPTLKPERSKSYSAGITLKPNNELTFDLTWWKFDFTDKIVTPTATEIVAANPSGTSLTPVVRDTTGRIVSVTTVFSNAAKVTTEGFDFAADFNTSIGKAGDLNINLSGTYLSKYDYQAVAGGAVIQGAGASNDNLVPPPNTKMRLNARATWRYGGGTLNIIGHYYAPIDFTRTAGYKLGSWFPVDINYTHEFDIAGTRAMLGVGAQNVFGDQEPFVPVPGFQPFIPSLYDTRGTSIYVKAGVTF